MSIADEINRISTQKNIIRDKMRDMGLVGQTESPTIDGLASKLKEDVRIDAGSTSREVLEGESITIQAGYYKANVTVSGKTNLAADKQKIKALESKIIPTKSEQDYPVPEGYYGYGSFTVAAIGDDYQDTSDADISIVQDSNGIFTSPDVLPPKIVYAKGKRVLGGMPKYQSWKETLSLSKKSVDVPFGFHSGSTVSIVTEDAREVTPDKGTHSIFPENGKVLSVVTVNPIPTKYKDLTKQTITANDVLSTKKFIDKETGEAQDGAISDLGEVNGVLSPDRTRSDPLYTVAFPISKGYHNGEGSVSAIVNNTYEATPSETKQTIFANDGSFMGQFTVHPIPTKYKDLTNQLLEPGMVLKGGKYIDKTTGALTSGTVEYIGEVIGTINPYTQTGYYFEPSATTCFDAISITLDNRELLAELAKI